MATKLINTYRKSGDYRILETMGKIKYFSTNSVNFIQPVIYNKQNITNPNYQVMQTSNLPWARTIANTNLSSIIRHKSNLPSNLSSKSQVERVFFRLLGIFLNIVKLILNWTLKTGKFIVEHPKTKQLWFRLQQKIEDAKK